MKKTVTKTKPKYTIKHPTVQLAMAIGLFLIAVQASRGAGMQPWEIDVFSFIYNRPDWLRIPFVVITYLGSIYVLLLLLLIYLVRQHYHVVMRLLLTGLLAYLASGFGKDIWGRIRPHELLTDVVKLDHVVRGPGFPSGHTALAAALGLTIMFHVRKKYRPWIFLLILLVGYSRVYVGVHAPLDIVGGFAIGWAAYALFRHIRFYDTVFGRHAKPTKSQLKR